MLLLTSEVMCFHDFKNPCTHRRACEGWQVVVHVLDANDAGGRRVQAKGLAIHVLHFYFQLVFVQDLERK